VVPFADNDTAGAVDELGYAETKLNILLTRVRGEDNPGGQQIVVVRNHIDMAENASGSSDPVKASQGINAADTKIIKTICDAISQEFYSWELKEDKDEEEE
jgi:hypothetical protein